MPQVLTALRGSPELTDRWKTAFLASGVKDRPIVAVNNAEDDAAVREIGGLPIAVPIFHGTTENERVQYIANIYEQLIRAAKSEWVILWDDDILPPWKGLENLILAARKQAQKDTAGFVTLYPYSNNQLPGYLVLFLAPYTGATTLANLPQSGLQEVWGGGTGLSIWRREALLSTLPWAAYQDQGWDRDLAIKLEEAKLKTIAECSIRCRHDSLPA